MVIWTQDNPILNLKNLPLEFCLKTLGPLLSDEKVTKNQLPMKSFDGLSLEFCIKVLGPLLMNWVESTAFIISFVEDNWKKSCEKSLNDWKSSK